MEKNNIATVAKTYWFTVSKFYNGPNFFDDYLTNEDKRFQTGLGLTLGDDFWLNYADAYEKAKLLGDMILRAKVVNKRSVLGIYHIWKDFEALKRFESRVDPELFLSTLSPNLHITQFKCAINTTRKNKIFNLICDCEKKLLQVVREDHRYSGMTIGDPLKYPTITV